MQVAYAYKYLYQYDKSDANALLAKKIYEKSNNKTGLIKTSKIIASNYADKSLYPQAIELYNQAIVYAEQSNDQKELSGIYNELGLIYDNVNNFNKALSYYNMAFSLDSVMHNREGMGFVYNNLGKLYAQKGENGKALSYYIKSIRILSALNKKSRVAVLYSNIGNMYFETNDYQKAIEYYNKSIKIKKEICDKDGIANTLNNIGAVFIQRQQLDSTLAYFTKAKKLYSEVNNKYGIAISYGNIGEVYKMQGKYAEAIKYIEKSILLNTEISNLNGIAKSYLGLGKIYVSLNKRDSAVHNFYRCLDFADKSSDRKTKLECLKQMAETQAADKDYKNAYNTYKQYLLYHDSLSSENLKQELLEMQIKYETENKDKEISSLNTENSAKVKVIKTQKYLIALSLLFFLIVTAFALVYYQLFRRNKKANLLLSKQNAEIEAQKEKIVQQRDMLSELNNELEKQKEYILQQHHIIEEELKQTLLKSEILQRENIMFQFEALKNQLNPHFLFNTFSTLIPILHENPSLAESYVRHLSSVYRYILTGNDKELVQLKDELNFIHSYMFLVSIRFDNNVKLIINVADEYLSKHLPLLSLQLLIENAVKHNITSTKKPLIIEVTVENNHIIVKNNLQKKSSIENSTGIGLMNIAHRYKLFTDEQMTIIQTNEEFIVSLPLLNENSTLQ